MTDAHKDIAISFLTLAACGSVSEAFAKYVGVGFRHHNPWFAGSPQALMKGMQDNAAQNPNEIFEIKRAIAEGDLVVVHSRVRQKLGDRDIAVVHILRFDGDRIVEMWDVGQPVPEESANQYGMF